MKIAPDLSQDGLASVIETCVEAGAQGLIVGNTTISRPTGLRSVHARESGGLSGAPLQALANTMLARAYLLSRGRLTLVGVGGVVSATPGGTEVGSDPASQPEDECTFAAVVPQ